MLKLNILTPKGTCDSAHFEPSCVKIGQRISARASEKNEKALRETQTLRARWL